MHLHVDLDDSNSSLVEIMNNRSLCQGSAVPECAFRSLCQGSAVPECAFIHFYIYAYISICLYLYLSIYHLSRCVDRLEVLALAMDLKFHTPVRKPARLTPWFKHVSHQSSVCGGLRKLAYGQRMNGAGFLWIGGRRIVIVMFELAGFHCRK